VSEERTMANARLTLLFLYRKAHYTSSSLKRVVMLNVMDSGLPSTFPSNVMRSDTWGTGRHSISLEIYPSELEEDTPALQLYVYHHEVALPTQGRKPAAIWNYTIDIIRKPRRYVPFKTSMYKQPASTPSFCRGFHLQKSSPRQLQSSSISTCCIIQTASTEKIGVWIYFLHPSFGRLHSFIEALSFCLL
jgi:hypothetical protein